MTEAEHTRIVTAMRGRRRLVYDLIAEAPKTQKQIHEDERFGARSTKVSVEEIPALERAGLIRSRRTVKHSRSPSKLWEATPAAEIEAEREKARKRNRGLRVVRPEQAAFMDLEDLRRLSDGSFTEWEHCTTRIDALEQLLAKIQPMIFWRAATDELPETAIKLVSVIEWAVRLLADMDQRWADDAVRTKVAGALALAADLSTTDGEREAAALAAKRLNDKLGDAA